jgi:hypothetical protein
VCSHTVWPILSTAVILYVVEVSVVWVGVPEIEPVAVSNTKPGGNPGEIAYVFGGTPPENTTGINGETV